MWEKYNPNPKLNRVGDCTVRAITKATGQDWETVYAGLSAVGFTVCDMPSANVVWGLYLKKKGSGDILWMTEEKISIRWMTSAKIIRAEPLYWRLMAMWYAWLMGITTIPGIPDRKFRCIIGQGVISWRVKL